MEAYEVSNGGRVFRYSELLELILEAAVAPRTGAWIETMGMVTS